jgi:hypothetical protein
MVAGRQFWNVIWYGILLLGILGLLAGLYWGRRTHWRNLDELVRALGTILVSLGMLSLLNRVQPAAGQLLLVVALICFAVAFGLGRRAAKREPPRKEEPEDGEP